MSLASASPETTLIKLRGNLDGFPCVFMIDSGSSGNFVSDAFSRERKLQLEPRPAKQLITLANGASSWCTNHVPHGRIQIGSFKEELDLDVTTLDHCDVILGKPWLTKHNPEINWKTNKVFISTPENPRYDLSAPENSLDPKNLKTVAAPPLDTLKPSDQPQEAAAPRIIEMSALQVKKLAASNPDSLFLIVIEPDCSDATADPPATIATVVISQYSNEWTQKLLKEYQDVFPDDLPPGLPPQRAVDHRIELLPGSQPVCHPLIRMSPRELDILKKHLADLNNKEFIEPSISPWGANIVFAHKKDGEIRVCYDYRPVNKQSVKNKYPLPRTDELFDRLRGAKYFTKLDLRSGYHQIRVAPEDVPKTAFRTRYGSFQFRVLPFGLTNAPATFQALMNSVFADYLDDFIIVYLDDILIYSKTKEQHERHVRLALDRLRQHKLYAKASKCEFMKETISFLGHTLTPDGIRVDDSKIAVIKQWPQPKNIHALRSFIGLANYYRRFVRDFSKLAAPLTGLLRKDVPYLWTTEHQQAFDKLKTALSSTPVIASPDPDKPYLLTTDASDTAIGAVLTQDHGHGQQPIAFESRKLTPAEQIYPTHDKELLAIVHALKVWRHYLEGADLKIITDHHSLTYFKNQPNLSRRQARWMEFMQQFNLDIAYAPGKTNVVADALSRHALDTLQLHALGASSISTDLQDRIKAAYASDPIAQSILRPPDDEVTTSASDYIVTDDGIILYGKNPTSRRIYVPDAGTLRQDLLREHHDIDICAHLGMDKTVELISRSYFWPHLADDVREYVRSCPVCQANKSTNQRPIGLLQPLATPTKRWTDVSMDLITQLPKTASGHDAIMVVVDRLTKMVLFAPTTTNVTSPELAKLFFDTVYRHHGLPSTIVSDRDPRFTSLFWKALFKNHLGTRLAMSTSNHPQTDGQTERANRTLEDMLRPYVNLRTNDWDQHLTAAEFAYNNSRQASTGFSPFYLNYGRHPVTPATLASTLPIVAENQAAADFLQQWQDDIAAAKQHLAAAQQHQAHAADAARRHHEFQPGDKVLLSAQHLRAPGDQKPKLSARYHGPFKILEMVSPVAAKLEFPPTVKIHPVIHVSQLKPFVESVRFPRQTLHTRPPPDVLRGQQYYNVEAIVGKKTVGSGRRRVTKYLVHWEGFPAHERTWEPEENLQRTATLRRMLAAYNQQRAEDVAS